MTDRRAFLKTSAVAFSALALSRTSPVIASGGGGYIGIVYTKDNPGKWAKKVASHAPVVNVVGSKVTVETKHGMSEAHFIVRHTLVLADGVVVGAKTFTAKDKPVSTYTLPQGYKGTLYATSFCNLHDFWLTEVTV
ncbi:MAG TPA: twin-arginine translocation signal domain-containing protein [Desulfobulbaceae bacterium]|nr:twin-arginine translocation signal domain-containing protein [Desulfobulbaceae bacterium]